MDFEEKKKRNLEILKKMEEDKKAADSANEENVPGKLKKAFGGIFDMVSDEAKQKKKDYDKQRKFKIDSAK